MRPAASPEEDTGDLRRYGRAGWMRYRAACMLDSLYVASWSRGRSAILPAHMSCRSYGILIWNGCQQRTNWLQAARVDDQPVYPAPPIHCALDHLLVQLYTAHIALDQFYAVGICRRHLLQLCGTGPRDSSDSGVVPFKKDAKGREAQTAGRASDDDDRVAHCMDG